MSLQRRMNKAAKERLTRGERYARKLALATGDKAPPLPRKGEPITWDDAAERHAAGAGTGSGKTMFWVKVYYRRMEEVRTEAKRLDRPVNILSVGEFDGTSSLDWIKALSEMLNGDTPIRSPV